MSSVVGPAKACLFLQLGAAALWLGLHARYQKQQRACCRRSSSRQAWLYRLAWGTCDQPSRSQRAKRRRPRLFLDQAPRGGGSAPVSAIEAASSGVCASGLAPREAI